MENLVALCGKHHRAAHVGRLVVRGSWSTGLVFEHADGRTYGSSTVEPTRAGVLATVLELLVGMGFSHLEAQRMLDRIRAHVGAGSTVAEVLLAALRAAPDSGAGGVREVAGVYEQLAA